MNKRNEKKQNLTQIIEMLRRYGAMTQARLKEYCGLQASTVSYLVTDLKQSGIIRDSGVENQQRRIGKPGNIIELDNTAAVFLGMYVEDAFIDVYLIGLDGTPLCQERIPLGDDPVKKTIIRTVREKNISNPRISGIGIAVKAIVYKDGTIHSDKRRGTTVKNRNWSFAGLQSELQRIYPQMPIVVENDANCSAELFNFNCKREKKDIVLFLMNREPFGIGCGLLLDGKIYRGFKGSAGELFDSSSIFPEIAGKETESHGFLTAILEALKPYVMQTAAFLDPECFVFTGSCMNGFGPECEEIMADITAKTSIPVIAESGDVLNPAKGAALFVIDKFVSNLVNEIVMG